MQYDAKYNILLCFASRFRSFSDSTANVILEEARLPGIWRRRQNGHVMDEIAYLAHNDYLKMGNLTLTSLLFLGDGPRLRPLGSISSAKAHDTTTADNT